MARFYLVPKNTSGTIAGNGLSDPQGYSETSQAHPTGLGEQSPGPGASQEWRSKTGRRRRLLRHVARFYLVLKNTFRTISETSFSETAFHWFRLRDHPGSTEQPRPTVKTPGWAPLAQFFPGKKNHRPSGTRDPPSEGPCRPAKPRPSSGLLVLGRTVPPACGFASKASPGEGSGARAPCRPLPPRNPTSPPGLTQSVARSRSPVCPSCPYRRSPTPCGRSAAAYPPRSPGLPTGQTQPACRSSPVSTVFLKPSRV